MLRFIKAFILFLLSIIGNAIIFVVAYLYGFFVSAMKRESHQYHFDLAIGMDQYINGVCKYLFNFLLIHSDSHYKFGNVDETISSVIGKNKIVGSLSKLGLFVDAILERLDKGHSINSIDKTE